MNSTDNEEQIKSYSKPSTIEISDVPYIQTLSDDFFGLFQCIVCFETILPPIMQCQNGHLICKTCRPKVSTCPTCRGYLSLLRNFAMERIVSGLKLPCKYGGNGCKKFIPVSDKTTHEDVCNYRPNDCPYSTCCWEGVFNDTIEHLKEAHNLKLIQDESIKTIKLRLVKPNISKAFIALQNCFKHNFVLLIDRQINSSGHMDYLAVVRLIGSEFEAKCFMYRLELASTNNINGTKQRLIWEGVPLWTNHDVAQAIKTSNCFKFDHKVAEQFGNDKVLRIKVTISQLDDSSINTMTGSSASSDSNIDV